MQNADTTIAHSGPPRIEVSAGRAGVFVYCFCEAGVRGVLLHNTRQVRAFCGLYLSLAHQVRAAWSSALDLRAAHIEATPVRVSRRPEAA